MKTNLFRKIASIFVSLAFIVSMAVPVFALDATSTGKITINGLDGKGTVNLYQVININYQVENNQPKNPVMYWNNAVGNWLSVSENFRSYVEEVSEGQDTKYVVSKKFLNLASDSDSMKSFVDELSANVASLISNPTASTTLSEGTTEVSFNQTSGAYLALVKGGVKVYNPIFTSIIPEYVKASEGVTEGWYVTSPTINANIILKSNTPNIIKTVSTQNVAIGDTVTYTLTVTVPQYLDSALNKTFIISDTLLDGLKIDKNTIKSTGKENSDLLTYFTNNSSITNGFEFTVKSDKYNELLTKLNDGKTMVITFNAKVTNKMYVESKYDSTKLENTGKLKYVNDPYNTNSDKSESQSSTNVFTYGLQVTKKVDTVNDLIEGTTFTLKKGTDLLYFKKENDVYYKTDDQTGDGITNNLVVDSSGKILILGLQTGTDYVLTETIAPKGYSIPEEPSTKITIADTNTDANKINGELDVISASGKNVEADSASIDTTNKNQLNFTIINYKNDFNLPNTGGIGTMLFTVAGIMIMGGAVVMMIAVAKKKKEQ